MQQHLIFGLHSVLSYLESGQPVIQLNCLDSRQDKRMARVVQKAKQKNVVIRRLSRNALDQLAKGENHQGVILAVPESKTAQLNENSLLSFIDTLDHPPFILVLDGVLDPHNLGACWRTADAAGVDVIIVPKNRTAPPHSPVVKKVACGASEHLPLVTVSNLARCLEDLKQQGIWVLGLAGEAEQSLFDMTLEKPLAVVMGAEGEGMRQLTQKCCDYLAHIPMQGSVSSLNVSVATGVTLFHCNSA